MIARLYEDRDRALPVPKAEVAAEALALERAVGLTGIVQVVVYASTTHRLLRVECPDTGERHWFGGWTDTGAVYDRQRRRGG